MYTKQTWADGDIITAAKLNHIEQGIVDSGCKQFLVTVTKEQSLSDYTYTPDHTFDEVMSLINDGYYPVYRIVYTGEIQFFADISYTSSKITIYDSNSKYGHSAIGFHNDTIN